jgi:hypothetical protein
MLNLDAGMFAGWRRCWPMLTCCLGCCSGSAHERWVAALPFAGWRRRWPMLNLQVENRLKIPGLAERQPARAIARQLAAVR